MRMKDLFADVGDRVAYQVADDVREGLVVAYGTADDELLVQLDDGARRSIRALQLQRIG